MGLGIPGGMGHGNYYIINFLGKKLIILCNFLDGAGSNILKVMKYRVKHIIKPLKN